MLDFTAEIAIPRLTRVRPWFKRSFRLFSYHVIFWFMCAQPWIGVTYWRYILDLRVEMLHGAMLNRTSSFVLGARATLNMNISSFV